MKETLEFMIQGDSEGFITFECPFCHSEFKLRADEFQNEDLEVIELFCPYCGLTSVRENFFCEEILEKAKNIALNYFIEEINKSFSNMSNNVNRSGKGFVKMTFKPLKKVNVKEINEQDTAEEIFNCPCCGNHEKVLYCVGISKVFCSYCGVDII